MNGWDRFQYVDRASGRLRTDLIQAGTFLDWCYNTRAGRLLACLALSRRAVSSLYGWYHRRPFTRRKIRPFVERMGIDRTELVRPPESYTSFADFFEREIDLSCRPVDPDPAVCTSPADGRVMVLPMVDASTRLALKGGLFDLAGLLRDPALADSCAGGSAAVVRLYLGDYHHFHFPDSGVPSSVRAIEGGYDAVSPYSWQDPVPFYSSNARTVTVFDSDHFGRLVIVEVGALTVGSIRQDFQTGARVAKGQHKGRFELGASIVVLLFRAGAIRFDADLLENSARGLETYVRMGESVGRPGSE